MEENNLTIQSVSDTSVDVSFETLHIGDTMVDFYGYKVQYRRYNDTVPYYNNSVTVQHNQTGVMNVTIDGLQPGFAYVVRVLPFRQDLGNDLMATGFPSPEVRADTASDAAPPGSEANVATAVGSAVALLIGLALVAAVGVKVYIKKSKGQQVNVLEQTREVYKPEDSLPDDDCEQQASNTPTMNTDHDNIRNE
jgi:hypothetical protein